MPSILDTRYDRAITQLLRDALKHSYRDARSRSRHDLAVASLQFADLYSTLTALMRAGLVLSWLRNAATARKAAVTVETEWEREEDWQRFFM